MVVSKKGGVQGFKEAAKYGNVKGLRGVTCQGEKIAQRAERMEGTEGGECDWVMKWGWVKRSLYEEERAQPRLVVILTERK